MDLWAARQDEGDGRSTSRGISIELKAIQNNKNFKSQVIGLPRDLSARIGKVVAAPVRIFDTDELRAR